VEHNFCGKWPELIRSIASDRSKSTVETIQANWEKCCMSLHSLDTWSNSGKDVKKTIRSDELWRNLESLTGVSIRPKRNCRLIFISSTP